jgi:DNA-binding NarL/FixJ family response regulator
MREDDDASARKPHSLDRVLIADDHALVRTGIKMLVHGVLPDAQFFEVADGDALLAAVTALPSMRLVLIDLQMPKMFAGRRLAEVALAQPDVPLIVLSSIGSPEVMRQAMSIPTVYAFLLKSASTETVHTAIEAALARTKFTSALQAKAAPTIAGLTPRQEQIRALLRRGMSNKRIAAELGISEGTVKNHVTEIFKVLKASNRTQAAQTEVTD